MVSPLVCSIDGYSMCQVDKTFLARRPRASSAEI
jgi:hypothetical protein